MEGALVNLRPNRSITYPAIGNSVMSMAARSAHRHADRGRIQIEDERGVDRDDHLAPRAHGRSEHVTGAGGREIAAVRPQHGQEARRRRARDRNAAHGPLDAVPHQQQRQRAGEGDQAGHQERRFEAHALGQPAAHGGARKYADAHDPPNRDIARPTVMLRHGGHEMRHARDRPRRRPDSRQRPEDHHQRIVARESQRQRRRCHDQHAHNRRPLLAPARLQQAGPARSTAASPARSPPPPA